jgi:hypothetical protein
MGFTLLLAAGGCSQLSSPPLQAQSASTVSQPWRCLTASVAVAQGFQSASTDPACAASATRPSIHLAATTMRAAATIVIPHAPGALMAAVIGSDVTLTWTTPAGADSATSYLLEAGSRTGLADLVNADTRSPLQALTITNVPPGTYFVRVRVRNANGTSAPSSEVAVTIPADCLTAPGTPSGLTAIVSGTTVTLTWQPPATACPATAYTVEGGSAPGLTNLASFSTGTAVTSFTATSVPGGTYYVRVKATNAGGASGASNEVSFSVGACATAPAAPAALTASVTGTTVVLTWTAPSGAPSTYLVEAGSTPGASNVVVSDLGSAATSLTATAAPATYYVRLRARNACGTSAPSNEIVVVVNGSSTRSAVLQASFRGVEDPGDASFDATIAAGPDSLIVARNTWVTIRSKTGVVIATKRLTDFFASARARGANAFTDPYVIFDSDSQRFFLANSDRVASTTCTFGTCVAYMLLAVSKTATPSTLDENDWYFYALDQTIERTTQGTRTVAKWGDFPFMSVVGNTLAMSMSMVDFVFSGPETATMTIRLLDKSILIRGAPVTTWTDFVGLNDTALPATTFGDPGGIVIVSGHPCSYQISRITNLLSSPVLTARTITTCTAVPPINLATQPGGAPPIQIVGPKQQYVYRNGSLWAAAPNTRDWGSGAVTAIYWVQIDVRGWPDDLRVVQSGTFGVDGVYHWVPAIMVDASNNMAIVFERSSPNEFVSAYYTWRRATDPPGTLRPGAVLQAGSAPWTFFEGSGGANRFVDYISNAPDPVDGSMWMLGMYARTSSQSGTWVGHLVFP